jgi:site-specific recombinase XerD
MLLSEAIEALCIATRANGRSPATVAAYREKCGHLVTFLGDVHVQDITVDDLRRYVAGLWDGELSPHTVAGRVRHAKRLFNWLVGERVLASSPMARIKTPDPDPVDIKAIDPEDLAAMLATCDGGSVIDVRDKAIMLFLIDTGARVGGLCGLRLQDADLEAGRAEVIEKGGRPRLVGFTGPTVDAMRDWLAVRPNVKTSRFFVGLARGKRPMKPRGVAGVLDKRADLAGVTGPHNAHSFRHQFAINFLSRGGDIGVLSKLMGHKNIQVTVRWYGRFAFQELQRQSAKHSLVMKMYGGDGNGDK